MPAKSFAFDYPNKTLQEILLEHYMKKTARWLLGEKNRLHAYFGNSHWEAAMSIEFLLRLSYLLDSSEKLYKDILQVRRETIRWLLAEKENDDGFIHWDGVTWDTAVVLRAIFAVFRDDEKYFSDQEKVEIKEAGVQGLAWLFKRFYEWEKEVKYPFGTADVAQILITAIYILEMFPDVFSKSLQKTSEILPSLSSKDENEVLDDISNFLKSRKENYQNNKDTCFWEDFFQTAEVLEALSVYFDYIKKKRDKPPNSRNLNEIEEIIRKGIHTLEVAQVKGMWGTHADTCRALYSYIKCCKIIDEEPEPQIVFKSLRWMCDEKQTFKDGSFLHTSFITIFYAHAIMEVYTNWTFSKKRIIEIYDDVLWFMEASSSIERGKRLNITTEYNKLKRSLLYEKEKTGYLRKWIYTLLVTFIFITLPVILHCFNIVTFQPIGITLTGMIYTAIIGLIWTFKKGGE